MSKLVFGTDPEMFAGYEKGGDTNVLPAAWFRKNGIPFIPDPKDPDLNKHPVFIDNWKRDGVIIMEDGVAFEQSIMPSTDWKELFEKIQLGKSLISKEILSNFPRDCMPKVQTIPTIGFEVSKWKEFKDDPEFMMSLIFGCDPDRDAWNKNKKGKKVNALKHPERYGGGHVHISGSKQIIENPILAIQCLTISLGLAAVGYSDTPELDKKRTFLYGVPGKYRYQEYNELFNNIPYTNVGIEYRTPSNRWTESFNHAKKVFEWAEIGIINLLEKGLGLELIPKIGEDSCDAVISCDQEKALQLLSFVESRL